MNLPATWTPKTSKQVLYRMLELTKNQQVTFVMVTHEPELAECADRVVTILDGKVCSNVVQDEATKTRNRERTVLPTCRAICPSEATRQKKKVTDIWRILPSKRLFSLLMVLTLAAALCLPVWADDSNPDSGINNGGDTSTVTTDNQGVYVTSYTVTTPQAARSPRINVGDQVNIVLQVVDHSSARYAVKAEDIVARINSSIFTYTGTGEIGQLFESNDDPDQTRKDPQYNYYSYVLLFRDVIYNGGGNTLPINLSYLDTSKPLQQFSVTLGQCVDKDQATTPNLIVRTSNYGDAVTAGTAFTLSLGLYATDGNEALNDVIVSLTLPENISLGGGSLSNYVGSMAAKSMQNITFSVLPAAGFTGTVADITVNMTGTGAISGKAVSSTTAISVPISQPDRFEVGQLQLSSESIMVGDTGSVTLSYVNKGKTPSATWKPA